MIVTLTPLFMAIAIDIMQGQGPTNEMCLNLQPKKTKVKLYYAVTKTGKGILCTVHYQQDEKWPLATIDMHGRGLHE